jgi:hypothetical protein
VNCIVDVIVSYEELCEYYDAISHWCDNLDALLMRHESLPLFDIYQLILCLLFRTGESLNDTRHYCDYSLARHFYCEMSAI